MAPAQATSTGPPPRRHTPTSLALLLALTALVALSYWPKEDTPAPPDHALDDADGSPALSLDQVGAPWHACLPACAKGPWGNGAFWRTDTPMRVGTLRLCTY